MKSKKLWKMSALLLIILLLSGAVVWNVVTELDERKLNEQV